MKIRLRLVYADGDAAATLLRPRRWSYAFVALLYPFYIKSEVLIYFQLNVNDRGAQVVMHKLAVMNHRYIMLDDWRSRQVSNGAKIRNRYNQVPHLTQDTNGKVTNSQKTPQTRAKRSALSQQVTESEG